MTSGIPRGREARWMAAGLLGLAFVAGAIGGVASVRLFDSRAAEVEPLPRGRAERGEDGARGPGGVFPAGVPLARELQLTPEQRQRIQQILREERAKADSVMREVRPILQARYDSSTQAVRAVLTPEQRERFDRLRENRRERLRRRLPPGR